MLGPTTLKLRKTNVLMNNVPITTKKINTAMPKVSLINGCRRKNVASMINHYTLFLAGLVVFGL